eukprot:4754367-Pleurochrysis_carterae.AAC.1
MRAWGIHCLVVRRVLFYAQMRTQRDAAWRKRCNELKAKFPGQESEARRAAHLQMSVYRVIFA